MEDRSLDAVGLVRRIRDELYEKTKDMSPDELIAFYRERAAPSREKLSRLRAERMEAVRERK